MRILLVCPYFAPENTIGAVRITKFAQYWAEANHEVTVLTRQVVRSGGLSVPAGVTVLRRRDPTTGAHDALTGGQYDAASASQRRVSARGIADRMARLVSPWPDRFAPWALLALARPPHDRPDVVVASGGPLSSLLLGAALARRWGVPWVADYRDLLSSGDYLHRGRLRRAVESRLERRAVGTAAALTAVSPPMTISLSAWLGVPGTTVTNGFDPHDYPPADAARPGNVLRVVYCGEIYAGKRDPAPVFQALADLEPDLRERVIVEFYGSSVDRVEEAARASGVLDRVSVNGRVSYEESLRLQRSADVLLSLMWDDPREASVYSGKLFEYIGAGRPILSVGCGDGVAARLIEQRGLGVVTDDAASIRDALEGFVRARSGGEPPALTSAVDVGDLTRQAQSALALGVVTGVAAHDA